MKIRRRRGDDRGSVAVEFALILPVFLMLVYAGIAFGVAMSARATLTEAAADGARAAIGGTSATYQSMAAGQAKTAIDASLPSADTAGAITISTPTPVTPCPHSGSSTSTCVTVAITYNYAAHPLIPNLPGMGVVMPSTMNVSYTVQVTP